MVSYITPTIPIFQNNNIKEIKNCYIIRRYKFDDKSYAMIQIELIDKRSPNNLTWFTVDTVVREHDMYPISQYITVATGKSSPKLYKMEWGDKQTIKSIINENLVGGYYDIISEGDKK